MKILNIPTLGLLSLALSGCFGDDRYDHDHSLHHSSSSSLSSTSAGTTSSTVGNSSSLTNSSSSALVISSIASSLSSSIASSSAMSSIASSSSSAINIADLSFSAALNSDQSIKTDSVENLGSALIGLIDEEAYNTFYMSLIAQGLDQAAIAKAVSVLGPVSNAIGADFIKAFSGQALLPAPAGINLVSTVTAVGEDGGVEYGYSVNQTIDDVKVALKLALRFEDRAPTLNALTGRPGYNVYLDGLKLVVNELSLTTSRVTLTLDTTTPLVASSESLSAQVMLTPDSSGIVGVTFKGKDLKLNLNGTVVNGIIGVKANAGGTVKSLNAALDLVTGSSTVDVMQPDVTIKMQGIDTGK